MITFDVTGKVLSKEDRSIPRRDGNGTFDFIEITIQAEDKQSTRFVARLADPEMEVYDGETYKFRIGLLSNEGRDGRIWNNFVVMAFKTEGESKPTAKDYEPIIDDELPF